MIYVFNKIKNKFNYLKGIILTKMKIIFLIIIMLCFIYIGFSISEGHKKKTLYIYDFKNFLVFAKSNISYNFLAVNDIVKNYNFSSYELKLDITKCLNGNKSDYFFDLFLSNEKVCIKSFFDNFGKKDFQETINLINITMTESTSIYDNLIKNSAKNTILPLKLLIYLGAVICILLV